MPKSSGDYWADVDVRLYDIAHDALVNLPINLWSFLILNRTDANSKNGRFANAGSIQSAQADFVFVAAIFNRQVFWQNWDAPHENC
jgi:hypothetical protein